MRKYLLLAIFLAFFSAQDACAGKHDEFTPQNVAELQPDEGYLLLVVDSGLGMGTIKLAKQKGVAYAHVFEQIDSGHVTRLIKLPEGRYRWTEMSVGTLYWTLDNRPDLEFTVERGVINYPGTLVISESFDLALNVRELDEATMAIKTMTQSYPKLIARLPLHFQGQTPDPYPDFYRRMKEKYANAPIVAEQADSTVQRFAMDVGLPAEDLFRGSNFSLLRLNPDASLVAFRISHGNKHAVYLFDVATAAIVRLADSEDAIDVTWAGRRTLALDMTGSEVHVYQLPEVIGSKAPITELVVPGPGYVMTALPDKDGTFLYAIHRNIADSAGVSVYAVDGKSENLDWKALRASGDLATAVSNDYSWIADRNGVLRLGMARVDKQTAVYFRGKSDKQPHEVVRLGVDDVFIPVGVADDGEHFYALTNRDRAQRDLVLVDGKTGSVGETVYSRPGTDLIGAVFGNGSLQPTGVRYGENGQIRTVYFAGNNVQLQARLDKSFEGLSVFIIETSKDEKLALIGTEGPTSPTQYYLFHVAENRAEPLSEDFGGKPPVYAQTTLLKSKSSDGKEIESYLTMPPRAAANSPLLVVPHGGPIGVRDYNLFDAESQFFASRGFVVLRVNYRGSEGFGKSFQSAGEGQWGSAIEDDIQSAVDAALLKPGIDRKRIAIVGTSYGGYSALMSVIRFPDEYRAAVAIAAPSDLPLMFNSSDWSYSDKSRERMKKIVGDPVTELDKLEKISPVYQFERIRHPVMFVHGDADRRVSIEHSERMQALLSLKGIDAESIRLPGGGHGITNVDDAVTTYEKIADFLARNLN